MVDKLEFIDTPPAFAAGEFDDVSLVRDDGPARIVLDKQKGKGFPREGTWTGRQVATDFLFTELLPCWNLTTPPNTGVIFCVRSRDAASHQWTPWLRTTSSVGSSR